MGVLAEWRCAAHDLPFESFEAEPRCPAGCSHKFVVREFRTAPKIKSGGTRVFDTMQRQLASDYNLTDMRNDKDGSSVMSQTRRESGGSRVIGQRVVGGQQMAAYWNPSIFAPPRGWAARGEPAPVFNPASAKLTDGGVPVKQIAEGARQHLRKATVFAQPRGAKK